MSWLPRSIATSFNVNHAAGNSSVMDGEMFDQRSESRSSTPTSSMEGQEGRGVKNDLSEIKNSLARRLRGVASFLAPPPQKNLKPVDESEGEEADLGKIDGIRSDFAEIGGKVKAGISKLLQIRPDDGDEGRSDAYQANNAVGVTEDVLAFVKDLVVHPRTWVRFPLPEDAGADDFALNDWQQAHAGAVERQVPELADLRWELCPDHMSEGRFWTIYFVLVHPKLDKYDALALSTPKIVEVRAMLTQESKHQRKVKRTEGTLMPSDVQYSHLQCMEPSIKDIPTGSSSTYSSLERASDDLKTQKHLTPSDMDSSNDNPAPKEASAAVNDHKHVKASKILVQTEEDDDEEGDDWLNEEPQALDGSIVRHVPISIDDADEEEDISFSDLEEDDVKAVKGDK